MNSSNHNSSCNFSDLLVSYLYGEIGEPEKFRFESHVSSCGVCAEEIAAFGGVRASVQNWRETEFAVLSTPVFDLPFEKEKTKILSTETTAASRSRLAGLREMFSLSPVWTGAATACAALAICAGLFYVALSSSVQTDRSLAGTNKNASVAIAPSPTVESTITAGNAESGDKQPDETPKPEISKDKKQIPSKTVPAAERTVVNENTSVKPLKTNVAPKPSSKEKPASSVKKPSKQSDIEFSTREEEDKSLRLADLFDEVSMK